MAVADSGSLLPRVASALVLAPIAILIAWLGGVWLQLLTAAAAALMGWEWARLCNGGEVGRSGQVLIAVLVVSVVVAACGVMIAAVIFAVAGAALVFWMARGGEPAWQAGGLLWIAVPCILLLWLSRFDGAAGHITVLWIFAIVWATDIGAYAVGRQVGGPRLAPRFSPRKTWSGLIGGVMCAALAGWATAAVLEAPVVLPLVLASAGLAIIEQFGDLAESVAKRRFNVKDSSGLIPGHGGLLDRLDGLLAVIPAVALLTFFDNGHVLIWR